MKYVAEFVSEGKFGKMITELPTVSKILKYDFVEEGIDVYLYIDEEHKKILFICNSNAAQKSDNGFVSLDGNIQLTDEFNSMLASTIMRAAKAGQLTVPIVGTYFTRAELPEKPTQMLGPLTDEQRERINKLLGDHGIKRREKK